MSEKKEETKPEKKEEKFEPRYIMVDANYLALRSQQLGNAIIANDVKDPKKQDAKLIIESTVLHGANNMILEILEKFDSPNNKIKE